MSKIFQTGALLAALISSVAGHTSVEKFEAGGKTYDGFRQASKQDPGNKSPAWWTNQGWGYQPVMGSKLNQYVYAHDVSFTSLVSVLIEVLVPTLSHTSMPPLPPTRSKLQLAKMLPSTGITQAHAAELKPAGTAPTTVGPPHTSPLATVTAKTSRRRTSSSSRSTSPL
jgi:hypothetical protein